MGRIIITLDHVMKERGINNRVLADQLGLTEVHISRLKHGNVKAIRLDTLYALCGTLHCEPGDILKKID